MTFYRCLNVINKISLPHFLPLIFDFAFYLKGEVKDFAASDLQSVKEFCRIDKF